MLIHHDSRGYEECASEAATLARGTMQKKIDEGKASAARLLEHVHTAVPVDAIVKGRAFNFTPTEDGLRVTYGKEEDGRRLHRHALGQMAEKAKVPGAYLDVLSTGAEWQRDLAAEVLNRHFTQGLADRRFLARAINGEVRGFLSDRFRRLDSRPLLDTFAEACNEVGAVPVDGVVTDTRVAMKAFLPMVFEPVPHEVMCLGVEWGNSDFGAARHTIRAFVWRLFCTNKAVMENSLAQVHVGRQMAEDIEFSERTYRLDTATAKSALGDIVRGVLSPPKVNGLLDAIRQASEKKVDWTKMKGPLARVLSKAELKLVGDAYESEDVINLPAGQSAWRASNAVSWIAGKVEDPDRKLRLERIAGEVLTGKKDSEAGAEVDEAA